MYVCIWSILAFVYLNYDDNADGDYPVLVSMIKWPANDDENDTYL